MLRQLWILTQGQRRPLGAALLLTLTAAAVGVAQPLAAKGVIDALTAHRPLLLPVAVLVLLLLAQALIGAFAAFLLERTGERFVLGMRTGLVSHLLRIQMRAFDHLRVGDLMARASTDVAVLREALTHVSVQIATNLCVALGSVGAMFVMDPVLMLLILGVLLTASIVINGLAARVGRASMTLQTAVGAISAGLERVLSALRTVRANRAEQREIDHLAALAHRAYDAAVHSARLTATIAPAAQMAINAAFVLILLVGAARVDQGALSLGALVATLLYATQLTGPVTELMEGIASVNRAKGAIERIQEVYALPTEDSTTLTLGRGTPGWQPSPRPPAPAALEIRDLRFGYSPDSPVLRGLSLTVPPHALVALVGPSGAGKSTVLALINRFYEPWSGSIRIDGRPAAELSLKEWRSHIGWVEQDCPILHGTLRDNLCYAAPDTTDDRLWQVLGLVNLTHKIHHLPAGLNTEVGERGVRLSSGERQRIAIARAVLARPRLLLMDEPTAHLDPANEAALTVNMHDLRQECALLVIAHRMSTIEAADTVVMLSNGTAHATGTYAELLRTHRGFQQLTGRSPGINGTRRP
ncbi:ABC transporter ATP-binding protein [Streptomyces pinistramenti]|uniref:ABC transporter ATP-binding protein n=1 Tax=Streptomyces pinistramenti TaxID=2884812 RepID=UPI001D078C51|nr:ABC transporter ATP-binding protein [Streptomyces pinistramenti]MCB5907697.1 ABC transporter ATP-binding protein/permease [Streptomyces pinistramenti]